MFPPIMFTYKATKGGAKTVFGSSIRMHFDENSVFGKILKLFYKKWLCWKKLCLVGILKNAFFLLNNILLVYIM